MELNNANPEINEQNPRKKYILLGIVAGIVLLGVFSYFKFFKTEDKKSSEIECLKGQTEIYEKYKDAVGLIQHTYTYEVSIKGCKPFELSGIYYLEQRTITGTGFFVSENGEIITNKHVAQPWLYEELDRETADQYAKEAIAAMLPDSIPQADYKNFIETNLNKYYDEEGFDEEAEEITETEDKDTLNLTTSQDSVAYASAIANALKEAEKSNIKYVDVEDIEIKPKTISISIAMHNSKNTWIDCKVIKASENSDIDVAILQTTNELLPDTVANIINLETAITNDESIKPGTKAILIGYPMGMTLANTRKGIKVQVYEGQINKETDGVNLQYNVTSTHGASGSPVFDECGRFIAVNFAGYDDAQGYNFGIVAKHVINLTE